jgi:alpha-galactosidase
MSRLNAQATLAEFARPGGWNDPDMLEVGNGSLTPTETTAHFGMWCMLAAPLFLGTSIDGLPANAVGVLTNPELIAIDQDSLGSEARRVSDAGGVQVWTRRLADGSFAIAILNGGAAETTATLSLAQAGVPMKEYTVRNVIEQTVAGSTSFGVSGFVPAHGLIVFRLTPAS